MTITVKELKEQLEKFKDDDKVIIRGPQYRASEYYITTFQEWDKTKKLEIFLV